MPFLCHARIFWSLCDACLVEMRRIPQLSRKFSHRSQTLLKLRTGFISLPPEAVAEWLKGNSKSNARCAVAERRLEWKLDLKRGLWLRSNLWSFGKVFGWLSVTFWPIARFILRSCCFGWSCFLILPFPCWSSLFITLVI